MKDIKTMKLLSFNNVLVRDINIPRAYGVVVIFSYLEIVVEFIPFIV